MTMKLMDLLNEVFIIEAGGQTAGKLGITKIDVQTARDYLESLNFDVDENLPNFDKSFKLAQKRASLGSTKRKDMPVIMDTDVAKFQERLRKGYIDIRKPFSDDTDSSDPFPKGLSGEEAERFLKRGLTDGEISDDKVDVKSRKEKVSKLIPIQKQIYFDTAMNTMVQFGVDASISFISNKTFFITSTDNYIIDGHHRYLQALILDPNMQVNCLSIDLPIKELLPLSLAYGDAIGNNRNE